MIKARVPAQNPGANLRHYEKTRQSFLWSDIDIELGLDAPASISSANHLTSGPRTRKRAAGRP